MQEWRIEWTLFTRLLYFDRNRRALQVTLTIVMVCALALCLLRVLPFQSPFPLSAFEAYATWALLVVWPALVLSIRAGWRRLTAVFLVLAIMHLVWAFEWVPRVVVATLPVGQRIRVLSANLLAPAPNAAFARRLLRTDADVFLFQELSDEWWEVLKEAGIDSAYPHQVLDTHPFRQDYMGIGIASRHPLERAAIESLGDSYVPLARADIEIAGTRTRLYSIHTLPPFTPDLLSVHGRQIESLQRSMLRDARDRRVDATVYAGDFNASPTAYSYRALLGTGFFSAHEAAGRGYAWSWPNGFFPLPPLRLDHAFIHGGFVKSIDEIDTDSSDHKSLLLELVVTTIARGAPIR